MGFDAQMRKMAPAKLSPIALAVREVNAAIAQMETAVYALRAAQRAMPEAAGGLGVLAAGCERSLIELRSQIAGQANKATLDAVLAATGETK